MKENYLTRLKELQDDCKKSYLEVIERISKQFGGWYYLQQDSFSIDNGRNTTFIGNLD
jgi:hypothetical protein